MVSVDYLFFDVDGTLVDSRNDIVRAMNSTLDDLKLPRQTPDFIISQVGRGVEYLIQQTLGADEEARVAEALPIFSKHFRTYPAHESKLYPHVHEILHHYAHKTKFILTNRKTEFAQATLEALGVHNFFEAIIGADDPACLKPSPCPVRKHPRTASLDTRKAIMIGDMDVDVMTGKGMDMKTCWVSYGLGKSEEVLPLKPDFVINALNELPALVS